ncbi:MAG TPA: branched-chain amino acid ABC transporter permease [Deltaproteobacteria bacterium]|nr:MAG: ABC transporter permease [Deltaproteobacteria bacterium GWC2_65_14]HBO70237.1 branched-chain amino acid ABC transporter permease [Deltaproteobacteria bacterium]
MSDGQKRKERIDRGIKVRSDGIYAMSSLREMLYLAGPRILLIAGLLLLPLALGLAPYWKRVINILCVYALLAISFDFLANCVGLVCLGGAMFIGLGGYFAAVFNVYLHLPVVLSIPAATVAGAVVSTLLILPCLSLRGVYFAIVTLMYPLLFTRLIEAFNILGGSNGITGLDSFPGQNLENYSIIGILLAVLFALRRLQNADIGLVLHAVKDNDQSVRAAGIDVVRIEALAVFIASGIGCLGGAYLAHLYMWAGVSLFALDFSIIPIAAVTIGGGGSLFGAVMGSFILVPLSEFLRMFGTFRIVLYCLVLTGFIVFKSEGLMSYCTRKYQQFERWKAV